MSVNADKTTEGRLSKLNRVSESKLIIKEGINNKLEDAHEEELIKQSKNRSKLGKFLSDWVIALLIISTAFATYLSAIYFIGISKDPEKLEKSLALFYSGLKTAISENQSIIAVIATLMFGDKLKNKSKKET